jgi:hypothetical protein
MTIYDDGDGWRNEDSEGPAYIVRTNYHWQRDYKWNLVKVYSSDKVYRLYNYAVGIDKGFLTIGKAKKFAEDYDAQKWHSGAPPHAGWWNASINETPDCWRWWDGSHWSYNAFSTDSVQVAAEQASLLMPEKNEYFVRWSFEWPKNARVKRVRK